MNKCELRKEYKFIRGNIQDRETLEKSVADKVITSLEYIEADVVCIYVSFGSELNTLAIIEDALVRKKIVGVPVVTDGLIDFYRISSLNDLEHQNSFGIREPIKKEKDIVLPSLIDLMIIPGICFDFSNNRLGFGSGYYDKYLANSELRAFNMGVCFGEQILKDGIIPVSLCDVKMDKVIHD